MNTLQTYFVEVKLPFDTVVLEVRSYNQQHAMKSVLSSGSEHHPEHDFEVGEIIGVSVE